MPIEIFIVVGAVVAITVLYKALPLREAGDRKPFIALLPKYKKRIECSFSNTQLEQKLSEYGFQKTKESDSKISFSRGSILGDISIKLAKVNVVIERLNGGECEVAVQAAWVVAFDTGDHWGFINELCEKLQNA
jgi:hypothetical protein